MTQREANQKIDALEAEILSANTVMEESKIKKHDKWMEIKDFGIVDSVAADRGLKYMKELTSKIETSEKVIRKAFIKIEEYKQLAR